MRRTSLGLAIPVFALAIACGTTATSHASTVVLGQHDAGRTVQVRVGDTVQVTLEDNFPVPGSALIWSVTSPDVSVLQPGQVTRTPSVPSGPGSHRTYTAEFHAMVAGQSVLDALGVTSCEAMAKQFCPNQEFKITVVVTG